LPNHRSYIKTLDNQYPEWGRCLAEEKFPYKIYTATKKSGKNQGKNGDNHLQNDESQNPSKKKGTKSKFLCLILSL